MSSFAKLKELALKRAETEQGALSKQRELQEKDAAAKQAAREAEERAQRERERKILVQKMTRQKEEEAREKARRESMLKSVQDNLNETEKPRATAAEINAMLAKRKKPPASSGSTQKVDLSGHVSSKQVVEPRQRKRKMGEDDFVGNRFDRSDRSKTATKSSSTSAARKKAMPLTREEKQAIKKAKEFGSVPRGHSTQRLPYSMDSSPSPAGDARSAKSPTQRFPKNSLLALGTMKRDQRSIDEIERDLRKVKEASSANAPEQQTQAELQKEAALLRRQKAMEEKRKSDQLARQRAVQDGSQEGSGDDSMKDEPGSDAKHTLRNKSIAPSHAEARSPVKDRGTSGSKPLSGIASARDSPPIFKANHGGVNPADFLPGAPLPREALARLAQKSKPSRPESSTNASVKSPKQIPVSEATASPAPPKRETARDRFIREQAEKKAASAKTSGGRSIGDDRSDGDISDEYDSDAEDQYDSEDDEEEEGTNDMDVRNEIWKMFGKDRRVYARKVVDSDDDMEADAASVLQEELRSAKQAKLEDQREEERERQREREKALRKRKA